MDINFFAKGPLGHVVDLRPPVHKALISLFASILVISVSKASPASAPVESNIRRGARLEAKFGPQTLKENATTAELSGSQLLLEPLVPMWSPQTSENRDLARALSKYSANPGPDNLGPLEDFIRAHPRGPWTLSVKTNLGLLYFQGCYWSKAFATLDAVWREGSTVERYKPSVDMALARLAHLSARGWRFTTPMML